jgi:hypothetical protein
MHYLLSGGGAIITPRLQGYMQLAVRARGQWPCSLLGRCRWALVHCPAQKAGTLCGMQVAKRPRAG